MVDKFRDPMMTPKETARHLRIPVSTVYYWLGENAAGEPLVHRVPSARRGMPSVPFIAVVEAYVLRTLREAGYTKSRIREIADHVRRDYGTPYGLATKRFAHDGIDIYIDDGGDLARVTDKQMPIREMIAGDLKYITWDETDGYPNRLRLKQYPDSAPVILDPRFGWGSPVVESNRVPIDAVADMWMAGDSIHDVAYEYGLSESQVESIVREYTKQAA